MRAGGRRETGTSATRTGVGAGGAVVTIASGIRARVKRCDQGEGSEQCDKGFLQHRRSSWLSCSAPFVVRAHHPAIDARFKSAGGVRTSIASTARCIRNAHNSCSCCSLTAPEGPGHEGWLARHHRRSRTRTGPDHGLGRSGIAADCLVLTQSRSAYPSSPVLLGRRRRRADAGFGPSAGGQCPEQNFSVLRREYGPRCAR